MHLCPAWLLHCKVTGWFYELKPDRSDLPSP
jgi:hypothetical protein